MHQLTAAAAPVAAAGNSYQGSTHAAVVLQRGRWNEEKEHLLVSGHQGEAMQGSYLSLFLRCGHPLLPCVRVTAD